MIEKPNFSCKIATRKQTLSDRDMAIRNEPKGVSWTKDMVKNLIEAKVEDQKIKKSILDKLKSCPDGALGSFVKNLDRKINQCMMEGNNTNQSNAKAVVLTQATQEVTTDELLRMKNSLSSDDVNESAEPANDPGESNL